LPAESKPPRDGWAELYDWRLDRGSAVPVFRQIYMQVRGAVLSRVLMPGARLPATRKLAIRLGAARASVVAAYDQLLAEGYIVGRVGSGTYVSTELPEAPASALPRRARRAGPAPAPPAPAQALAEFAPSTAQADERPFNTGRTLIDARTAEIWRKLTHRAVRELAPEHLGYADPRGAPALRKALAEYLQAARGVRCSAEQIVVTAGTQQATDIATRVLLAPGDTVWVEDPGYFLTHRQLTLARAVLQPVPVDGEGLDVDRGIGAAPRARAVFVTPSHQFPTGVVLSMARRLALLDWARRADAFIVEDDYASEFRYSGRPLAALQGLDAGDRVIYVGTFNKALFPGLRIGYAVVPPALLPGFVAARYLIDRQPPSLSQAVVAEFMRQGHLTAHIRRMRLLYRDQRDALAEVLARRAGGALRVAVPDQGMHLVAELAGGLCDLDVEAVALRSGIVVRAMSRLFLAAPRRSALMLGFSGFPRQLIVPAAARLGALVARIVARSLQRAP
jgi:GntR family transcriptional regulator/MocR family aminotransferase